jgi:signal transduction histidine kinase/ActR/RegA family two-component response regulator
MRQESLLRSALAKFERAAALTSAGGAADAAERLRLTYDYEPEAEALWLDIAAYHRAKRLDNERALRDHGRRSQVLAAAGAAAFALGIFLLIAYVRRRVVGPLKTLAQLTGSVALGDLTRRVEVTHEDEIGDLQRSFNRMITDLEQQRIELSALVTSLSHARDAAQAASRAKSDFLAHVSHEIRTPMNGLVVSLDLIHETTPDPERRELADVARSNARSLLGMLNDLLDFSSIEAGRLRLESLAFEPRRLVGQLVELHRGRALAKALTLTCDVAAEVPARLCGDPKRVGQVLLNLLDNAIKFTDRGSIAITVSVDPPAAAPLVDEASEPPVWLRLQVSDSGVGITPEAALKVFQPFYQAEESPGRNRGGIGLGLDIARRLARRMGGDLGFESTVGTGSSFWFTVPLSPEERSAAGPAPVEPPLPEIPAGCSVLLAEDHRDTREMMVRTLQRRGLRVTSAENGRVALEKACAAEFDLLLMDCRMPEMDGFEVTRRIRALGGARAGVPIVALTAYGLTENRQRYLDAGFDDVLAKPYTLEDIEAVLRHWLVPHDRGSASDLPDAAD